MAAEFVLPEGVAELIGKAREAEAEVVARERRERQGQAAVDDALATATDLLRSQGEKFGSSSYDTRGIRHVAEENYSVEPVTAGEDRLHLTGRMRTSSGNGETEIVTAGVEVYVLFTAGQDMSKGRKAVLFSINGTFGIDGEPQDSKMSRQGAEVTDPDLRMQYASTIPFIAEALREKPGTQPSPQAQPRTARR